MRLVETSIFTRQIRALLTDEEYRELQTTLILRPRSGAIIWGSGGLRKVRWGGRSHGRRGGIRVIYFWHAAADTIFMLFAYSKNDQDDLTPQQVAKLRRVVREDLE